MDRCALCPCPSDKICPASSHARYCHLVEQDTDNLAKNSRHVPHWINFIADNGQAQVHHVMNLDQIRPVVLPRSGSSRDEPRQVNLADFRTRFNPSAGNPHGVVQIWPMACIGGAERAMISVMKATAPEILWRGVGLLEMDHNAPEMVAELRSLCPVAIGPDQCRQLITSAKVVVVWAVHDIVDLMPQVGPRPKIICVSHSPSESAWAMKSVSQTIGIDHWVAVSQSATLPIPESERSKAVVIPNAIDPERIKQRRSRAEMRASWGISGSMKILGCYHRQSSEKDPTALARAIRYLPEDWIGVAVGDGFELERVNEHAERTVPGRVKFFPARTDAGNVLGAFDSLLVSSKYESFCLSMVEAFAVGTPVVSTPVGIALEHPELVREIPIQDDGKAIAAAVLADQVEGTHTRCRLAQACAADLWFPDRLGDAWKRLLTPMVEDTQPFAVERKAKGCVHRGCKTGCQHFICNRDSREVRVKDCFSCVQTTGA